MANGTDTRSTNAFTDRLALPARRPFSWKVFWIVLGCTFLGIVAVLPYAMELTASTRAATPSPLPPGLLLVLQVLQNTVLYGVLAGVGLLLACRIGLGLPFLEGWLSKQPVRGRFLRVLWVSVAVGIAGSLVIAALDRWIFMPALKAMLQGRNLALPASITPPAWQGLLASLEGGITEDVLLRLFALTFFAWLGSLVSRDAEGRPTLVFLWVANVLAAVLFGIGHLPATAAAGLPLTPLVIVRAIVLNGLLGVAFGWLYWTRGLESAVMAHFSADVVLHVVLVLL
jgi:hypothetical protein